MIWRSYSLIMFIDIQKLEITDKNEENQSKKVEIRTDMLKNI